MVRTFTVMMCGLMAFLLWRVMGMVFGSVAVTFCSWTEITCRRVRAEGTEAFR